MLFFSRRAAIKTHDQKLNQFRKDVEEIIKWLGGEEKKIIELLRQLREKEKIIADPEVKEAGIIIERTEDYQGFQEEIFADGDEADIKEQTQDAQQLLNLMQALSKGWEAFQQRFPEFSERTCRRDLIRDIEELIQFMDAFHAFSQALTAKTPILENILRSLNFMVDPDPSAGTLRMVVTGLCAFVMGLLTTLGLTIARGLEGALKGFCRVSRGEEVGDIILSVIYILGFVGFAIASFLASAGVTPLATVWVLYKISVAAISIVAIAETVRGLTSGFRDSLSYYTWYYNCARGCYKAIHQLFFPTKLDYPVLHRLFLDTVRPFLKHPRVRLANEMKEVNAASAEVSANGFLLPPLADIVGFYACSLLLNDAEQQAWSEYVDHSLDAIRPRPRGGV